jgi:hypothetical protein
MLETLQNWNLESKLYAITLDNVSVNNNFVTTLKENLKHPVRLAVKTLLNG